MSEGEQSTKLLVRSVADVTPKIRKFVLSAIDRGKLPRFSAGAHIDIQMNSDLARSYSLVNDPEDDSQYVIAVLREDGGRGGSLWMHTNVRPGDELSASMPSNNFPLHETANEHLLIAGGIGITPILSMAKRLLKIGAKFELHYCARSSTEAAFLEELQGPLSARTHTHWDDGIPEKGLNLALLLRLRRPGSHVYVCGPRGMIDAARAVTEHWPTGTVHFELFSSAPRSDDAVAGFEVEMARSGRVLFVPAHKSVLEVLEENGVKVKTVCRDGVCGTCKVRVLSGEVDHRDEVLDDEERKLVMQVCVSRARLGEKRLVLDL
jgi:vanillate O-demethylase ferredoxin subunit